MNDKINNLRNKIKTGAIQVKTPGNFGPKVPEGTYECLVTEATFGAGNNGNDRGMLTMKVIGGESASPELLGGTFQKYVQTVNQEFMEQDIAQWVEILTANGVDEEKLYYDADGYPDVIANICRQIKKHGSIVVTVRRSAQKGTDANGNIRYYNDIVSFATSEGAKQSEEAPAPAPSAPAPAPAPSAAPVKSWRK